MATGAKFWLACLGCASAAVWSPADAQAPSMSGSWSGEVKQNGDPSTYAMIMTLTDAGGTTEYPDLNCGGTLSRVGSAKGYVFFAETITRGGLADGGTCIDGSITVMRAGEGLAWSWTGSDEGAVIVAWSDLRRK